MTENGNTVNMESGKNRYHHGDLRAALIEEGLKLIDAGPVEALSLREIARNAGVSATAVYRHFPDKAALLSALCLVGDDRLADAFAAAMAKARRCGRTTAGRGRDMAVAFRVGGCRGAWAALARECCITATRGAMAGSPIPAKVIAVAVRPRRRPYVQPAGVTAGR